MRGKTFEKVFPRTPFQNFSGKGFRAKPFVWFVDVAVYITLSVGIRRHLSQGERL